MGTLYRGVDYITGLPASVAEYSIDPAAMALGAYAADSLSPHFTNAAGSVFQVHYWTPANVKFFDSTTATNLIFASRYISRDQEVETWARNGTIYLRLTNDGTAIRFVFNYDAGAGGNLLIGLVSGLSDISDGSIKTLYLNSDLVGTIPGFSRTDTTIMNAARFTFGAEGVDIYAKYNSVEFARIKDFRHVVAGRIAGKTPTGYGFRSTIARNFSDVSISSDIANNIIDARDFGLRSIQTTGSIAAGGNILTVADKFNLAVGDFIIVEIGKEPGNGLRGSKGVGGSWPAKSYVDLAAMQADTTQVDLLYAWREDTGEVYRYATSTSTWTKQTAKYYTNKAVPKALCARITAISGNALTLDASAAVSVTNANVYLDNAPVINFVGQTRYSIFGSGGTAAGEFGAFNPAPIKIALPIGSYAIGSPIVFNEKVGAEFYGQGKESTTLFSPKGTTSACMYVSNGTSSSTIHDFHLMGNARDNGFGLNYLVNMLPSGYVGSLMSYIISPSSMNETVSAYPPGGITVVGNDVAVRDCKFTDVFQRAVGTEYSTDCWVHNCESYHTDGLRTYVQWDFQWADSAGGGAVDCTVTGPTMIPAFESFRSSGTQFIRCGGTNAAFSINSAGDFLIQDFATTITAMSEDLGIWNINNPLMNINSNIQPPSPSIMLGGNIVNPHIKYLDYVGPNNNGYIGIVVNAYCPNITITGGVFDGLDWKSPATTNGSACAVNSTGENTVVDGLTVIGTVSPTAGPHGNIVIRDGVVRNCIADVISLGSGTGSNNWPTSSIANPSVPILAAENPTDFVVSDPSAPIPVDFAILDPSEPIIGITV